MAVRQPGPSRAQPKWTEIRSASSEGWIAHARAVVLQVPGDPAQEICIALCSDRQVVPAERSLQRPALLEATALPQLLDDAAAIVGARNSHAAHLVRLIRH